ncbi:ornithine carbamoyltransferase [Tilletia horrida]|nr:ornithine carbamoyltransferase [Tilletia horrida]
MSAAASALSPLRLAARHAASARVAAAAATTTAPPQPCALLAQPNVRAFASSAPAAALSTYDASTPADVLKSAPGSGGNPPPHLLTLADLSPAQIQSYLDSAASLKSKWYASKALPESLSKKSIALLFSKRSTRTRVSAETSVTLLGGAPLFLGPSDIQLGVNETLYDTTRVLASMVDGIFARVGGHDEVELLAKHSRVPIINALSARYHPTQILADLQTLLEVYAGPGSSDLTKLAGLKVAWVGDSNNILNDMLVAYPRLGIHLAVATPRGDAYKRDDIVWGTMQDGLRAGDILPGVAAGQISWSNDPLEAVKDADVIVTDTWISMGDEATKDQRLRDFSGFQVTEDLAKRGGAKPDWKFLHCLPRKGDEVDDEVFFSKRSVVFEEAENRKWTIMALFDRIFGHRTL